jgi:hypothetical protein
MSKLKLKNRSRSHRRRHWGDIDRAAVPPKFSYPKKPVTLAVPVIFTKCCCTTAQLLGDAIRQYVKLTGIVPYDWDRILPAPERFRVQMKPGDKYYLVWFGFDTMEEAEAAKAKFNAINRAADIWTEVEEREACRRHMEKLEKETDARPTYDAGDGTGAMYWRDHPYFKAA